MLGGGVPLCKITEVCGVPGAGKTQMCMQLAVDTHIPESLGGLGGEAIYVDTEGGFVIDRMVDIAEATVQHCRFIAEQEGLGPTNCLTVDAILAGTHYLRCQDHVELTAIVHLLPKLLKQHEKVRLVVIDSIACPFRNHFDDMSVRTRLLATLAQSFIKIASQFKVAIVLTNQMTTKITAGASCSHLIPALGQSWSHASTVRVVLSLEDHKRTALLLKSPHKPESSCAFQITKDGIRGVLQDNQIADSSSCCSSQAADTSCHVSVTTKTDGVGSYLPLKKQRIT
uniref:DNA repair protein RAD51 homolog 3 n=1 Tax=Cepaea nemoralis TaxID=28835 RepID=A0A345S6Z1_CEPNE|nr:DNA repair protein RAD51 [Cepaea nemoralis]